MTETAKRKRKLFQVAKELNLASETIKEFLEKKGVPVKSPNMRIPDEVYDQILQRFSFEKKEADRIQKRREERVREEGGTAEEIASQIAKSKTEAAAEQKAPAAQPEGEEEPEIGETAERNIEDIEKADDSETISEEEEVAKDKTTKSKVEISAKEDVADEESAEKQDEIAPSQEQEEVDQQEAVSEKAEAVAPTRVSEEESEATDEAEEKPKVGDIIDHPMAKQFLERQRQQERRKKERQKGVIKRLKTEKEPEGKARETKRQREDEKEKPAAASAPQEEVIPTIEEARPEIEATAPEVSKEENKRDRKKDKKKGRHEIEEEKEARRRKAFEMLRKERKRIRPEMIQLEEEEAEQETPPKEKEGRRKRQKKKKEVDQKEVDNALRKTLAEMKDSGTGRKKRKKVRDQQEEEHAEAPVIRVTEFITAQDLANLLDVSPNEIIRKCLELGLVVTINQRLDMDTIRLLGEEFGHKVEEEEEFASTYLEDTSEEVDRKEDLQPRAPVVTVMGHVDHGKTSLLDYIRKENVVAGESGGITQHIGAYEVEVDDGRKITFVDTPGHEAFTAMRARGAQVTDIVVLVIAADDNVMPQTEEALDHARAAGVSIVIAINKVDKPNANPEAIRKQLADRNVLVEDWGGTYQCVEVSAKSGQNIDELLEKILLEAELLELKANPNRHARGVVLESQLDKGKGPVATVLIQSGTLKISDSFVVGQHWGKVRAMINERGQRSESAGPSNPVQVLGLDGVPEAGDRLIGMNEERVVKDISQHRQQLKREQDFRQVRLMTLDELSQQIATGDVKELNLLVKADVDGSAQAITDSLSKLSTDTVAVNVIRRAVGPITESDVILATASKAIIIGFNIRPTIKAKELAEQEHVDIRLYKVIYDAIEDVKNALEGLLEPIAKEVHKGTLEVRETFKISRIGTIAGCYVRDGKITRNLKVRLIRNDVEIYDGKLSSLKRFKDDVREVQSGYECGVTLEGYNDIKVGDVIEAYDIEHEAQKLSQVVERVK